MKPTQTQKNLPNIVIPKNPKNMIDLTNNSVFDWKELKKLIGTLGEDPSYKKLESVIVEYMNQFIAVITDEPEFNGACYLVKTVEEGCRPTVLQLNEKQMQSKFENKIVHYRKPNLFKKFSNGLRGLDVGFGIDKSSKICISIFNIWKRSENRLEYKRIVYDPSKIGHLNGNFNRYNGLRYDPEECKQCYEKKEVQEKLQMLLDHALKILCNNNEEHYLYVMRWMATKLKYPHKKLQTCLIFRGMEGSGKGIFINYYGHLFGDHYTVINDIEKAVGRFNKIIGDKLMLFFDEACIDQNNKKAYNVLKTLITENRVITEAKFKDCKSSEFYANIICAMNPIDIPIFDGKSRRFVIIESNPYYSMNPNESKKYFTELNRNVKENNYETLKAFQHWLTEELDLGEFDLGQNPPSSDLKEANQLQCLDTVGYWLYNCLCRGYHLRQYELIDSQSSIDIFNDNTGFIY